MTKKVDTITTVKVDKDILDFLKAIYFGKCSDQIKASSSRAYRDMNRTIRFNGLSNDVRIELREEVNELYRKELNNLSSDNINSQEMYDSWHRNVSDRIKAIYSKEGILLTYGQTQKWINMTIKYLYMIEANTFDGIFEYLHIPLDNYVFAVSMDSFGIKRPHKAWSCWDDYDGQYLKYQKIIRDKISDGTPLRWEFRYWLKEARNIES
ncbi:MAG: hypothetical protein PUA49_03445 [Butyrivibrio sp.]|nr:hypothetical protein [Butyrivibrio sp.]